MYMYVYPYIYTPNSTDSWPFVVPRVACGNASCLLLVLQILLLLLSMLLLLLMLLLLVLVCLESWQATFWFRFRVRFAGCDGRLLTLLAGRHRYQPGTNLALQFMAVYMLTARFSYHFICQRNLHATPSIMMLKNF